MRNLFNIAFLRYKPVPFHPSIIPYQHVTLNECLRFITAFNGGSPLHPPPRFRVRFSLQTLRRVVLSSKCTNVLHGGSQTRKALIQSLTAADFSGDSIKIKKKPADFSEGFAGTRKDGIRF